MRSNKKESILSVQQQQQDPSLILYQKHAIENPLMGNYESAIDFTVVEF